MHTLPWIICLIEVDKCPCHQSCLQYLNLLQNHFGVRILELKLANRRNYRWLHVKYNCFQHDGACMPHRSDLNLLLPSAALQNHCMVWLSYDA